MLSFYFAISGKNTLSRSALCTECKSLAKARTELTLLFVTSFDIDGLQGRP